VSTFTLADFLHKPQPVGSLAKSSAKLKTTTNRNFKGKCYYCPPQEEESDVDNQLEEDIWIEPVPALPASVLVHLGSCSDSTQPEGWVRLAPAASTPPRHVLVEESQGILLLLQTLRGEGEEYRLRVVNLKQPAYFQHDQQEEQLLLQEFAGLTSLEAICGRAKVVFGKNRRSKLIRKETASYTVLSLSETLRLATVGHEEPEPSALIDKVSRQEEMPLCGICYCDDNQMTALLGCGHSFCDSCWALYLDTQLRTLEEEPDRDSRLTCPVYGCPCRLDLATLAWFVPAPRLLTFLKTTLAGHLSRDPTLAGCPRPSCNRLVRLKAGVQRDRSVACLCGLDWCVDCRQVAHAPATCAQYLEYLEYSRRESEYARLETEVHARPCPKCGTPWEKVYGCNHLTCGRCATSFCWGCGDDHQVESSTK
jgi:hypothetical protein